MAIESDEALLAKGGIAPMHTLFADSDMIDPETGMVRTAVNVNARAIFESVAGGDPLERLRVIRRIGCTCCQAQRHGYQAYNPFVSRAAALYDILLYGSLQPLNPVDTQQPQADVEAVRMVAVAYEADAIMEDAGVEIPLFW